MGYIIKSNRVKGGGTLIVNNSFAVFVPKLESILNGQIRRGISSEIKQEKLKMMIKNIPDSAEKVDCYPLIKTKFSQQYSRGIIKVHCKYKGKDVKITFVRADLIQGFGDSKTQWLMMKVKDKSEAKEESEQAPNQQKKLKVLFIKGNPKYWIKDVSDRLYKTIKNIVLNSGYEYSEIESNVNLTKLPPADIYIGFSRGNSYFCYKLKTKLKIAVGGNPNKAKKCHYVLLNNPKDKTYKDDHSKESLLAHWTLTNQQITQLKQILDKFKKNLSEISTMGAIAPMAVASVDYKKYKK